MSTTDLRGRPATDPEVQAAVLKSFREMPFYDLVAMIEGEEAAKEMLRSSAENSLAATSNANGTTISNGNERHDVFSVGETAAPAKVHAE